MKKNSRLSRLNLIKLLKRLKPEERKFLFHFLNEEGLKTVCSCVSNVLFEDWGLKDSTKKSLRRVLKGKEKHMRALAKDDNTLQRKKYLMIQYGGSVMGLILSGEFLAAEFCFEINLQFIFSLF